MQDLETDPDFQALLRSISFPALELIVALAKKRGAKESRELWELFDYVGQRWRTRRSYEGDWDGLC